MYLLYSSHLQLFHEIMDEFKKRHYVRSYYLFEFHRGSGKKGKGQEQAAPARIADEAG